MEALLSNKRPSDRKFGITFAAIFMGLFLYGVFASWTPLVYRLCALAGLSFVLVSAVAPQRLSPLNRAWFFFGELLGKIVSPLALGFIFFALITPVSIVARLFGRDELHLKRRPVASYWRPRRDSSLDPTSFKQQF